jgi:hypothetical protein
MAVMAKPGECRIWRRANRRSLVRRAMEFPRNRSQLDTGARAVPISSPVNRRLCSEAPAVRVRIRPAAFGTGQSERPCISPSTKAGFPISRICCWGRWVPQGSWGLSLMSPHTSSTMAESRRVERCISTSEAKCSAGYPPFPSARKNLNHPIGRRIICAEKRGKRVKVTCFI